MTLNLPPDPYKVLGVLKDAKLPEIRSAHRRLVLKCHPDKVQDAALKAIKQDEFQKVQQAYELLSDDTKRIQYDEQVKLFALRAELGRGNPTARSNPFEYEIKTAEPRANTYSRAAPSSHDPIYSTYPPRPSEEVFEERYRTAKKSTSYESDRRRPSTREGERERSQRNDDRERDRWERESKRAAHGEKKKSRDKERRRGTEEKTYTRAAYVEDESDYDSHPPRERKTEGRHSESARDVPSHSKYYEQKESATQYMQSRRKAALDRIDPEFVPSTRRSESYGGPERKYSVQHVSPTHASPQVPYPFAHPVEDDSPRRSSGRSSRRTSETPEHRSSKESSKKEHRRSPATSRTREGVTIVEPPSPSLSHMRSPRLPSQSSAPGGLAAMVREKPSRSKTQDDYSRSQERNMPPLPRAATFQAGDRDHARSSGSRLKNAFTYDVDSDSDSPVAYVRSPRNSSSPPRREPQKLTTKYIINASKATPVTRHRSDLRDVDDGIYVATRDRSESPRSNRHSERPPLVARASSSSRQAPVRSSSKSHRSEEPVIREARPSMPGRGAPHTSGRSPTNPYLYGEVPIVNPEYSNITFAPEYKTENVMYSPHLTPKEQLRRGSEPVYAHRDYAHSRSGPGRVYA